MESDERNELAVELANIASQAGKVILEARTAEVSVTIKPDGSPVTAADLDAEDLIQRRLARLMADVSVIGEETSKDIRPERRRRFFLVDPLDGTREFIAGSNEFTVNIALIDTGKPIVGVVFAPALSELYLAGATAFHTDLQAGNTLRGLEQLDSITTAPASCAGLRAIGSRSHMDRATEQWLRSHSITELRSAGSSLKFCLVARGEADVYPRLAPTMEWDTAAGDAILKAAGGCVLTLDGGSLSYGKIERAYTNSGFVAWGREPTR